MPGRLFLTTLFALNCLAGSAMADPAWRTMRNGWMNQGNSAFSAFQPLSPEGRPGFFQTQGLIWGTAVIDQAGTVYVGSADKNFYAINPNGKLKWTYRLFDKADALIDSAAALTDSGKVIVPGGDGFLHALDQTTGKRLWTFAAAPDKQASHQQGALVNSFEGNVQIGPNGWIYAGSDNGSLYALNDQGQEQWHFTTGMMIWSTPAFDPQGKWLAFGSLDGHFYLLDPVTGRLLDKYSIGSDVKSSPASDGQGNLYVGASDNRLHAFAVTSELKLQKRWDYFTKGEVYASPAFKNQRVVVGSLDGKVYALNPEGEKIWEFNTYSPVSSSPLITADNQVLFGAANGKLYALDLITGRRIWSYLLVDKPFKSNLDASVALAPDGQIWAGAYNGKVYHMPAQHCLSVQPVSGCEYGGSEDSPAFLSLLPAGKTAGLLYEDAERRLQTSPQRPLTLGESLRLRLVARDQGQYQAEAAINPASLEVTIKPDLPFETQLSSDGYFLHLLPKGFWPPAQQIEVQIKGNYFLSQNWLGDRLRMVDKGSFETNFRFETTALGKDELNQNLRQQRVLQWGIRSLFLYYPAALETYTPAALEGQAFILSAFAAKEGHLILVGFPALPSEKGVILLREPSKLFLLSGQALGKELIAQGRFSMSAMGGTIPFKDFRISLNTDSQGLKANQFTAMASCLEVKGNEASYSFPLGMVHKLCNQDLNLLTAGTGLYGFQMPVTAAVQSISHLELTGERQISLGLKGPQVEEALITVIAFDNTGRPLSLASTVQPLKAQTDLKLTFADKLPTEQTHFQVFVDTHPIFQKPE